MGETKERRMCTRTPFFTDVILRPGHANTVMKAELLNISISGMFVRIDQAIPVGTSCAIAIRIAGNHSRLVLDRIRGEVVRQDEHGVAIHFTSPMEWFVLFKIYTHYCKQEMEKTTGDSSGDGV